jgi:hypothetical protein
MNTEGLEPFRRIWNSLGGVGPIRDSLAVLASPFMWHQGENLRSRIESVRFVLSLPSSTSRFMLRRHIQEWSIQRAPSSGLFLEFGVAGGESIRLISRMLGQRSSATDVYGFDSFHGLPVDWRKGLRKGTFAQAGLPEVGPNVKLVIGLFEDTLEPFLSETPGPVSFVHIDCDLYSSSKYVLSTLRRAERLHPGTIILFDEFFNYPKWTAGGEFRAATEAFADWDLDWKVIAVVPVNHQVTVEIGPKAATSSVVGHEDRSAALSLSAAGAPRYNR